MGQKKASFFIMGEKGYFSLKAFIEQFGSNDVRSVFCWRDNGLEKDYFDEIRKISDQNNINFYNLKSDNFDVGDYSFAISWRWIIASNKTKLIILHDSLLPKYRGFNPLVSCLINGEKKIGVTAIEASSEYDRGNIVLSRSVPVDPPIKIQSAFGLIKMVYSEIVNEIWERIRRGGDLASVPQDEQEATYSLWRDEEDYWIDWQLDALRIQRMIYAVGSPYGGARTRANGELVFIEDAVPMDDVLIENRHPGKVIFLEQGMPVVVCGKGLLKVLKATFQDGSPAIPLKKFRTRFG